MKINQVTIYELNTSSKKTLDDRDHVLQLIVMYKIAHDAVKPQRNALKCPQFHSLSIMSMIPITITVCRERIPVCNLSSSNHYILKKLP
jgi:hypothetical protein